MEIRVIDFGKVTQHYKTYRDGMDLIEIEKEFYIESLQPLKKELQNLMMNSSSSTIYDRRLREQKADKFESLQKDAIQMEANFNEKIKKMNDETTLRVFNELEVIIRDWSEKNHIDLVTSKMEVIYNSKSIDATDDIIEIIKDKGLFVDIIK
jgi:Skp family chaperone for outer membrane proteins